MARNRKDVTLATQIIAKATRRYLASQREKEMKSQVSAALVATYRRMVADPTPGACALFDAVNDLHVHVWLKGGAQ